MLRGLAACRFTCAWEVPLELTDELERVHATMGLRPYPRRIRPSQVGTAAQRQHDPLPAELERKQMRISIV